MEMATPDGSVIVSVLGFLNGQATLSPCIGTVTFVTPPVTADPLMLPAFNRTVTV